VGALPPGRSSAWAAENCLSAPEHASGNPDIGIKDPQPTILAAGRADGSLTGEAPEILKALVPRLESGMIGLNRGLVSDPAAPFGGIKQSGLGREGGHHGLLEFLEAKYIATQW
jgi:hypothetical protein